VAIGKPILEGSSQGQKRSTTQILTLSDPKTLTKRAHNPYGLESAKPDLQSGFKKPGGDIPGP